MTDGWGLALIYGAVALAIIFGLLLSLRSTTGRPPREADPDLWSTGLEGRPIAREPTEHGPFDAEPVRLSRLDPLGRRQLAGQRGPQGAAGPGGPQQLAGRDGDAG